MSKVAQLVAISVAVFYSTRLFAREPPRTLTKEWQEASNEYAKVRPPLILLLLLILLFDTIANPMFSYVQKEMIEPITGISSPNYEGPGYVQSPPAKSS